MITMGEGGDLEMEAGIGEVNERERERGGGWGGKKEATLLTTAMKHHMRQMTTK